MISEELDSNILKLYEIERRLSRGAYGVVWKAANKETRDTVALKKIYGAFANPVDARRTYREVMLLREFTDHPNIVKLLQIYKASNNMDFYLVFEYMDADLHHLIGHGVLKENEKRYIMYQIIKAVLYIHSGNVIHRDIKPSNILIDTRFRVKIADFGLARSLKCNQEGEDGCDPQPLTNYVVSRWYRAPELLLGSRRYTRGVDMWSLGCVLGEMLLDKPLFPGTSTLNQMELILATVKPPTSAEIQKYFPNQERLLLRIAKKSCPLKEMLKCAPSDGVDLVSRLLVINPCRRLICEEALYHSYVDRYEEKKPVPMLSYDVHTFVPDDIKLTVDGYRRLLYELIEDQNREEERSKRRTIKKVKWCSETKSQVLHHVLVSSAVSEDNLCAKQGYMKEDSVAHQLRKPDTYPGVICQRDFIKEEKGIHCHKKAVIYQERLEIISNCNLPLNVDATLIQDRDSSRNNIRLAKDNAEDEYMNEKCCNKPCMDSGELKEEDYLGEGDSIPCYRKPKICPERLLKVNSYESCRADIGLTQDLDSSGSSIQLSEDTTHQGYMKEDNTARQLRKRNTYPGVTRQRDFIKEEKAIHCHKKALIYPERLENISSYNLPHNADATLIQDRDSYSSNIQLAKDNAEDEYVNEENCLKKPCMDSEELQEEDYLGEGDSMPCHRKPKICPERLLKVDSYESCRADIVPDSSGSSIQLSEDTNQQGYMEEDNTVHQLRKRNAYPGVTRQRDFFKEEKATHCYKKALIYQERRENIRGYNLPLNADATLIQDGDSSSSNIQLAKDNAEDEYMNEENYRKKPCMDSGDLQEEDYLEEGDSIPCHRKSKICPERLLKVDSYEFCRADTVLRQDLDSSGSSIQLSEAEDEYMNEENCIKEPCKYPGERQEEDYLGEVDSILCHRKPKIYPERLLRVISYESCRADTQDQDSSGSSIQLLEDTTKDEYMNEDNYLQKPCVYSGERQEEEYLGEVDDIPCHRRPKIYPERLLKVNSYESCRGDVVLAQDLHSSGSSIQLLEDMTKDECMNEDNCHKKPCVYSGELQEENYLGEVDDIPCHRRPKIYPERLVKVNSYESCRGDIVLAQDLDSSGSRIQLLEDKSVLDQSIVIRGTFSGNLRSSEQSIPLSVNFNLLCIVSPQG